MRLVIEFCRGAGMIEPPREMVDSGCALDCLLHPRRIVDISWDDRYCITELLARFCAVTCEYAHRLLAFYKLGHQGAAQETCTTRFRYGPLVLPVTARA